MAQFDNEDDTQQPIDVAQYIRQKYLAGVPSAAPAAGCDFDGNGPALDKATPAPDTSAATETEKADDSDDQPEYSAKGYQDLADTSKEDLQAARARAANSNSTANFGQALATMFKGGHQLDPSLYNNIRQGNAQALNQATTDRQELLKNYLLGNNLQRQATADQRTAQQFDWAKQNQQFTQNEHDRQLQIQQNEDKSDSAESQFAQRIAKTLDPKGNYDDLSATQIKSQLPMVKDIYDQTMRQQDMQLRWAQLNQQKQFDRDYKNNKLNGDFVNRFNKDENAYQTATGKVDETMNMVDQATNHGGVTSKLVPLEVARQIAGRLNPQEIAAAGGDPSIVGKIERMVSTAADGKMDGVDADEFRTLLQSQKDNLTAVRNKQRDQNITSWASATKQDPEVVRTMVLGQQSAGQKAPGTAPGAGSYTAAQEAGIKAVMDKNKISRDQAIAALKEAKKLP